MPNFLDNDDLVDKMFDAVMGEANHNKDAALVFIEAALADPDNDEELKKLYEKVAEKVHYIYGEPEDDGFQGNEMPQLPEDVPDGGDLDPDEPALYVQVQDNNIDNLIHVEKIYQDLPDVQLIDVGGNPPNQPQMQPVIFQDYVHPGKNKKKIPNLAPVQVKAMGQPFGYEHAGQDVGDVDKAYYSGAPAGSTLHASVGNKRSTRGLMLFYINVGNLTTGQALDLMDRVKEQYRGTEQILRSNQIEVMWLPRSNGETKADYFAFD